MTHLVVPPGNYDIPAHRLRVGCSSSELRRLGGDGAGRTPTGVTPNCFQGSGRHQSAGVSNLDCTFSVPCSADDVVRDCSDCGTPFTTKWRYRRCPTCRYRASYRDACGCGSLKAVTSRQCHRCRSGLQVEHPNLTDEDRAWLAGLLEAEGTFVCRQRGAAIRAQMTDEDVIARAGRIIQVGRCWAITPKNPRHKRSWTLSVGQRENVAWLAMEMAPLLGARRRLAVAKVLASVDPAAPLPKVEHLPTGLGHRRTTAWVAGVIEGDGSIRYHDVTVSSVDADVMARLGDLTGLGSVRSIGSRRPGWQPMYVWRVQRRTEKVELLNSIYPWMLARRSSRIEGVLADLSGR